MSWSEFSTLLSGLNHKTPLGYVVWIRSEKDPEVIRTFSKDQLKLRREYQQKSAKAKPKRDAERDLLELQAALKSMFGSGG